MNETKLIFMVDDDPIINTLVVRRFASEGYRVEAYGYGEECLEDINKNPDLIILDYFFVNKNKEVMNGMEVFDRIKELKPKMPVIMLSGQQNGEVVLDLARKGIDDYVIKDSRLFDNLNIAIRDLFDRRF